MKSGFPISNKSARKEPQKPEPHPPTPLDLHMQQLLGKHHHSSLIATTETENSFSHTKCRCP
eukprot:1161047-Pelagomonas_calceolata.AAC.22